MDSLTLRQPDDWHLHLRDGAALQSVVAHTAAQFARAIVMPNLKPPVTTTAQAIAYRERILAARPAGSAFEPLMTLYLTDRTDPAEMAVAKASGIVQGCKLYPAGATTNSDAGVTDIRRIDAVLEAMATTGLPLLVHGEVTHNDVMSSTAKRASSTWCWRHCVRGFHACASCSNMSPRRLPWNSFRRSRRASRPRSRRSTWPSTAMRCSRAASVRICTACPSQART